VLAREETMVRPERLGLKVAEVLADAGDSVTAGQTLARLSAMEHGGERHRDAAALARD
jgi:HlyD family secretion protein